MTKDLPAPDDRATRDNEKTTDEDATEGTESKSKKEEKAGLGDYFRIFHYTDRLDRTLYAIAAVCSVASGAALPLMTLVFGSSTSTFSGFSSGQGDPQQFQADVNHLVLYFVYLFVGRFVLGYVATLCVCTAAARTTNSLRKAFLGSLLRQQVSYFDMEGNGSVASQVTTNGNRINQGIAEKLCSLLTGLSLFFSAFIVALAVQWKLALITMTIVPAMVVTVGGCISLDAPIEARVVSLYSQASTIAQDALGSIKTITAFGAQSKIVKWYDEYLQSAHKEGNKKSIIYGVLFSSQSFLVMSGTALAFWQGFRMYQSGEIEKVGTVFTVVLSVTLGASSVLNTMFSVTALTNASSAAAELFKTMDKPSVLDPLSSNGEQPIYCTGNLEIRDLYFAYPSRPAAPVLQGFNLSIPSGKTTALVGPSGSGKSTIVGLLERWYIPSSGRILLDGQDIADVNTHWLRSNMRLVQQEPTLFQGTVFQNVAKGFIRQLQDLEEDQQMQLVQAACKAADAHAFVETLPEGYHTELGANASMLSGGQRQRLAIARSIISDPQILLFDEATSALDPRAERAVQDALDHVSTNKTTLIIAHKLATVMAADSIAVMKSGRVVEQGSHAELLALDGLYAAMVRAQDLGSTTGAEPVNVDSAKTPNAQSLDRSASTPTTGQETDAVLKSPTKQDNSGTLNYSLFRCILTMLSEHSDLYGWYSLLILTYIMVSGTYPAQAILFSRLLNVFTLQGSEARSQANFYALMFFIVALANLLGYFCVGLATNTIGQTLTHRYRREMIERMIHFDQDFFDMPGNSAGALAAKLSSAPSAVQELMSANVGLMVNVVVSVLACSVLCIAFGWKLGLVIVFSGLALIVAGGYIRIRLDQQLEKQVEEQFSSSASLATEAVTSIRTVSLLTLESSTLREYGETLDAIVTKVIRNLAVTLIPYSLSQSIDFLVIGLGFWYGSRLIASGEYSVTTFFVIFLAAVFGGQNAAQFFSYTTSITKATGSANYMLWLRTVKSGIRETPETAGRGPKGDEVAIGIDDVEFSYKQRSTKVLRGVSMDIASGSYIAFVGPSGCGKSTIVSLLERFYNPTSGRITINSDDISSMSPNMYRKHMSLVQQEPPLYLGSVRDNIALGLDYEPSDDEVWEACQQANALEFISSLPEGLNTPCGSKGLQFSGGQRQRIAVARALIRKPRLLLLDEATSALDTQSEQIVQKALNEAAESRTTVAVAHRLSTIRHADVIFVIEDGRIAEKGAHEELLSLRGRYYAMCLAQSLDQA